ncbi:MAG: type II toxin-antitoxin system PemK/MazF family toxin [Saprospiraceae bacterium]
MKKRGEIWWINFDPSVGQEVSKKRPAIVISNDVSNKYLKRYQVIPLSTQINKLYPSETLIKVKRLDNKAMADQLTTVSELRFIEKIGKVTNSELKEIERIIRLQLDL